MTKRRGFWERVIAAADLRTEVRPGAPLVELVGYGRLLIENHLSVIGYDCHEIRIKVKFGQILVSGNRMQLSCMSCDQLLITGEIESIRLCREGSL